VYAADAVRARDGDGVTIGRRSESYQQRQINRAFLEMTMTVDRYLRLIAGFFISTSILLGIYVDANFFWFTAFVGVNLFQSAFTNWCPMMTILRKAGVRR
jgi:hypothetical protein